jgi:Domain of unknown function (DUF1905)
MSTKILASGPLWRWQPNPPAKAAWFFMTIDGQTAAEIRYEALGRMGGFGSIKVAVTIGETRWYTSLFPHKESGGFLLPVKATIRAAEGLFEGDDLTVTLEV